MSVFKTMIACHERMAWIQSYPPHCGSGVVYGHEYILTVTGVIGSEDATVYVNRKKAAIVSVCRSTGLALLRGDYPVMHGKIKKIESSIDLREDVIVVSCAKPRVYGERYSTIEKVIAKTDTFFFTKAVNEVGFFGSAMFNLAGNLIGIRVALLGAEGTCGAMSLWIRGSHIKNFLCQSGIGVKVM